LLDEPTSAVISRAALGALVQVTHLLGDDGRRGNQNARHEGAFFFKGLSFRMAQQKSDVATGHGRWRISRTRPSARPDAEADAPSQCPARKLT
jgi:hypothetical protein